MQLDSYKSLFLKHLNEKVQVKAPVNLYEPVQYILDLGGKRLRPVVTLMLCDLLGGKVSDALDAALAIEVFHNFTLLHDDIMDSAPIRRGKETVHKKWDINTGILSGDAMMLMASRYFESYDAKLFKTLVALYNKTGMEVCEGQQLDMDFESRNDVNIDEYMLMIKNKTSVLIAAAMEMGALIADASEAACTAVYNFGLNLGLAFQLQDDYLDTFGDQATFGKQIGGDIMENKKTFLYLKALQVTPLIDREHLVELYNTTINDKDKVGLVTDLFKKHNVDKLTRKEIEKYTHKAFESLEALPMDEDKKAALRAFGTGLMERSL